MRLMNLLKTNILADTNVFISAFKTGKTKSTELFIHLIKNEEIQLITNEILLKEYEKYANRLGSKSKLFFQIIEESSKQIEPDEEHIQKCEPFFENSYADMIHASTCLKADGIILTNDKHFDEISDSDMIDVWDISKAINEFL